jgi:hypothetical protein
MAIMAAALDAAPEIRKQWTASAARSDLIKSAADAMQSGDLEACNEILAGLVEKTGAAGSELPGSKMATLPISKAHPDQREEFSAARLMAKRNRLAGMLAQLRSMRGQIGKAAVPTAIKTTGGITIATRLTKAEIARRDMLQHRLKLLRGQIDNARNWQPLPEAHHHEHHQ